MKLYAVFKFGERHHCHECGGLFSTLNAAFTAAVKFITGEPDDYQAYEVVRFELDVPTPQEPLETPGNPGSRFHLGGDLKEPDAVCTFRREKGEVIVTMHEEKNED